MQYNHKITGQVIGRVRTQRAIPQEVLFGLSGIARSHLAVIGTGTKNANDDTLRRISQALDMRLNDLIRIMEEEHDRPAR